MPHLVRDGVALAYAEAGSGAPPFLFVHGLACDRSYFEPQVAHFLRAHRTVAVDLRGHGESDKPDQEYTVSAFAADLAWLCEQLQLEKPVVVGHSLGGVVALALAAEYPDLASAIVMVDAPLAALNGPPTAADPRVGMVAALRGENYRDVARQFADRLFVPTDDRERRTRIVEGMASAPQHVFTSTIEGVWSYDLVGAASTCTAPALYIQAAIPRPELERFGTLCPKLVVGRTVGAGHFNMLEVPDQVNAMIERFLVTAVPSA